MYFWVARVIRNAPRRCTLMTVSQSFSDILKIRLSLVTPALLISTVGSPSSATTLSTAAATCSASLTSAPTAIALPPAFSISATVSAPSASLRSSTATASPSAARRLAVPAPMPRAAPVTIAIRCGISLHFLSQMPDAAVGERRCSCVIIPDDERRATPGRGRVCPHVRLRGGPGRYRRVRCQCSVRMRVGSPVPSIAVAFARRSRPGLAVLAVVAGTVAVTGCATKGTPYATPSSVGVGDVGRDRAHVVGRGRCRPRR